MEDLSSKETFISGLKTLVLIDHLVDSISSFRYQNSLTPFQVEFAITCAYKRWQSFTDCYPDLAIVLMPSRYQANFCSAWDAYDAGRISKDELTRVCLEREPDTLTNLN